MRQPWLPLAVVTILLAGACLVGCMAQPAQAETSLPEITTNISGTWNSVSCVRSQGDGFSEPDLYSTLTIEQEGWLFYGTIDGDAKDNFVATFCNEEGDVFLFDLSTNDSRRFAYGYVDGDNLWIGAVGITTAKNGGGPGEDIFADRRHFVREGGVAKEMNGFAELGAIYKQVSATQFDEANITPLAGDTFVVEGQRDGIIYGTIDQDVDGVLTPRKFIATGAFIDTDDRGHEYDIYLLIDEAEVFWILQYPPGGDSVSITTVARSEFRGDKTRVISGIREYVGENVPSGSSAALSMDPMSLKGTWVSSYIDMINENRADIQISSTIINVSVQRGLMFFGETREEYWVGDVGGVIFSPNDNSFYMASTSEGTSASLMQGWADGDTMYLFGTFTNQDGKNACAAVYEREAGPNNR